MNQNSGAVNLTWHFVSQFVSWEFCKNMCEMREGLELTEDDLLTFFREMVIKQTTKTHETEITKHEIVAKFLEEVKTIQTPVRLEVIYALSETLKRLCPELAEPTTKLLSSFKTYLEMVPKKGKKSATLVRKRMNKLIIEFSIEAFKLLPVPDLIKACASWKKENYVELCNISLSEMAMKRLKSECISNAEAEEILRLIENDDDFSEIMQESDVVLSDEVIPKQENESSPSINLPRITDVFSQGDAGNLWENLNEALNDDCGTSSESESEHFPICPESKEPLLNKKRKNLSLPASKKPSRGPETASEAASSVSNDESSSNSTAAPVVHNINTNRQKPQINIKRRAAVHSSFIQDNLTASNRTRTQISRNARKVSFARSTRLTRGKFWLDKQNVSVNLDTVDKRFLNSITECFVSVERLQLDPDAFDPSCRITIKSELSERDLSDTDENEDVSRSAKSVNNAPSYLETYFSTPVKQSKKSFNRKKDTYVEYRCLLCRYVFNSMSSLLEHHEIEHFGEKFPDLSNIRKIEITSPSTSASKPVLVFNPAARGACETKNEATGKYHCHLCEKSYVLSSSLPGHYNICHRMSITPVQSKKRKRFRLEKTPGTSADPDLPETEEGSTSGNSDLEWMNRKIKYQCQLCEHVCKRWQNLQQHYKVSHSQVTCPDRIDTRFKHQRKTVSDYQSKPFNIRRPYCN